MPYVEFSKSTISTVLELHYELDELPSHLIVDRSGNGRDAIARYPDTSSEFSFQLLPLETTGAVASPDAGGANFIPALGSLENPTPLESSNVPSETNPLLLPLRLLYVASTNLNVPFSALLIVGAFIVASIIGLIAYQAFGSIHIMYIAMLGASVFAVIYGDGIWGWLVPITFAIMGLFYLFYKKASV